MAEAMQRSGAKSLTPERGELQERQVREYCKSVQCTHVTDK